MKRDVSRLTARTSRWTLPLLLVLTAGAFFFRLPDLGNRPMHGDEAVHTFKFKELWEKGTYRYDPNEFHGPTLYYAALPTVWLSGHHRFVETREAEYRIVTVVFGAGLVLLLGLMADGIGWPAVLWAGLFTAVSPAFVFYSRYYIQEMLLAFFTLAALGCGWRYFRRRTPGWAAGAGLCAGLMIATKETAVLAFAAAAGALLMEVLWSRRFHPRSTDPLPWNRRHLALALLAALLTACLFLSGFFTHPAGPLDYFRAYIPWFGRAHGTGLHRYPWYHYLALLTWSHRTQGPVWSEGLIIALAVVGSAVSFGRGAEKQITAEARGRTDDVMPDGLMPERADDLMDGVLIPDGVMVEGVGCSVCGDLSAAGALVRFLVFYTALLTIFYSAIPYKTPWCVLSFLDGMILLAGVGATALVRLAPQGMARLVVIAILLAGTGQLAWQAYRTSYVYPTDGRNPYAYAQPAPDVVNLADKITAIARANPSGDRMVIQVLSVNDYYWPLPWYLRRFSRVGYWTTVPKNLGAPVVIASPEFDDALTKRLGDTHLMTGYFGLRPGVLFEVWVRMDAWKAYLAKRKS